MCVDSELLNPKRCSANSILFTHFNGICFLQDWSKVTPAWKGTYQHSAVCLGYGGHTPKLLVIGGQPNTKGILNMETHKWTQVRIRAAARLQTMFFTVKGVGRL